MAQCAARIALGCAAALLVVPTSSFSLDAGTSADRLVEEIISLVRSNYILEERVGQIEARLRQGLKAGDYARNNSSEVATQLTQDLRDSSADLHFGIRPIPEDLKGGISVQSKGQGAKPQISPPPTEDGFGRVELLPGNVGYIELLAFADPKVGGPAADSALQKLAGTDALILDVRNSRGGHPGMVAHLFSYFFDGDPFLFNRFFWRNSGREIELWTVGDLPSPRYLNRDVFVLTSSYTPSAAEGFSYHLKHWERAVVVGEPTAGAAHTTQTFTVGDYQLVIPTGRPLSSITGGNWEATGVLPDLEVPAFEALDVAHRLALDTLAVNAVDPTPLP
jgi:hypothetical protein